MATLQDLRDKFKPDVTPEQAKILGVLEGKYTAGDPGRDNYFHTDASMSAWPDSWHNKEHPKGWFQWWEGYSAGKITEDDERQIKRWLSFKARHLAQLKKADPTLQDLTVQPRRRQALLNWGVAPGVPLEKLAALADHLEKHEVQKHHAKALDKLEASGGLIANHSLGSGKTYLALLAAEAAQKEHPEKHVLISSTASAISQFPAEAKKFKVELDPDRIEYISHGKMVTQVDRLGSKDLSLVIGDELHKFRNPSSKGYQAFKQLAENSRMAMGLSATAMYNKPHDLAPLINLVARSKVLPDQEADFRKRFIKEVPVQPSFVERLHGGTGGTRDVLVNQETLRKSITPFIDHYDASEEISEEFPGRVDETYHVHMSPEQSRHYHHVEGKLPALLRLKVRSGLPLNKKELADLNSFSTGVRQVSVSHAGYVKNRDEVPTSPKIQVAIANLQKLQEKDPNFKGVVYSNFIDAGLNEVAKEMDRRGLKYEKYTGDMSAAQKDEVKNRYNDGSNRVLLLSSSGAEGLNLKGTKVVQILDPHFNESKIEQVIARGIRRGSHAHLPEEERKVVVQKYLSILPRNVMGKPSKSLSIEQYLIDLAKTKEKVKNQITELIKDE